MTKSQHGRTYLLNGSLVQTYTVAEDHLITDMAMCGYTTREIAQAVNAKFGRQRTRKHICRRLVRLRPIEG